MSTVADLLNKKFGRLTVIERVGLSKHGHAIWKCKCDCGNTVMVTAQHLVGGGTKSCGCYLLDKVTTHGLSKHPLYSVLKSMKQRCYNPKNKDYKYYGGRGIKICEEWKNNFITFYEWALSAGYTKGLTIERIVNEDDYYPENCKWVPQKEQKSNTRKNHYITYKGITQTLSQWSRDLGIRPGLLLSRLTKLRWSVEKALTTPPRKRTKRKPK